MGNKAKNVAGLFKNTRTRIIIVITAIVVVVAILIGAFGLRHNEDKNQAGTGSQVSGAPRVDSVPGSKKESTAYTQTATEGNKQAALAALSSGTSSVPTVLGSVSLDNSSFNKTASGYDSVCTALRQKNQECFQGLGNGACCDSVANLANLQIACANGADTPEAKAAIASISGDNTEGKLSTQTATSVCMLYAGAGSINQGDNRVNELLSSGALSSAQANALKSVCAAGMPYCLCSAEIDKMGKSKYKQSILKAYYPASTAADAKTPRCNALASIINKVSAGDAADIQNSCKAGSPDCDCTRELTTLVATNKISEADKTRLLGVYGKTKESNSSACKAIASMIMKNPNNPSASENALAKLLEKNGIKPPSLAAQIQAACSNGQVNTKKCQDLLRKLPASAANELFHKYGGQGILPGTEGDSALANLVKGLDPADRAEVEKYCSKSSKDYNAQKCLQKLNQLAASGALSPDALKKFETSKAFANLTKDLPNNDQANIKKYCDKSSPSYNKAMCIAAIKQAEKDGLSAQQASALANLAGVDLNPQTASTSSIAPLSAAAATPAQREQQRMQQLLANQQRYLSDQRMRQQLMELQTSMTTQASALLTAWTPQTNQQYVKGDARTKAGSKDGSDGAFGSGGGAPDVKAGNIEFAVMDTSVDSDQPGPIMARIVDGKFKGGKALGTLKREDKRVVLSFNLLSLPNVAASIPIDAVAIDANTARTALATSVNSHYLLRYGTLFASAFLSGYGQAVQQSGQTLTYTVAGVTKTYPETNPQQKIIGALGNVGQRWGDQLSNVFNTPPTVRVASGTGIGLLFLQDVTINKSAKA